MERINNAPRREAASKNGIARGATRRSRVSPAGPLHAREFREDFANREGQRSRPAETRWQPVSPLKGSCVVA